MQVEVNHMIYSAMTNAEYHAADGLSRSALWEFRKLPAYYHYRYLSGEYIASPETEALALGTLVHTMVLEPQEVEARYYVMPKVNRSTKVGKAMHAACVSEANGRTLVNEETHAQAFLMSKNLIDAMTEQGIKLYGSQALREHSIFWQHEPTRLNLKARPDALCAPLMIDIKTSLDASYRAFQGSAWKEGYYLQAAMLMEACKAVDEPCDAFCFAVVEKKPPYATALYMLDDSALEYGQKLLSQLLEEYKICMNTNNWPSYGVKMLLAPTWAPNSESREYEQLT